MSLPVDGPPPPNPLTRYVDLLQNAPEHYTRTELVVVGLSLLVLVLLLLVLGAVGDGPRA